jgi:site-specific DNA recombinase
MIAAYARRQLADRPRRGRLYKARKAAWLPWASRASGSRSMPKHAGRPPRGEIPPAQAAVGRHMFHWVIQEPRTTRQMVKRLNALKIPTRTGQHPGWPVARVRWMLSNPL